MNPYQISNVILNVTLIATFIGIFFFTYGKRIEQNIVKNQSELVASYLAKDLSTFIDKETAQKLTSNISIPDMSEADKQVEEQNASLQQDAFKTLSMICVGGILLTIIIAKYYKLNFADIFKTNIIILVFVAITEYIFLTFVGQNFISLDPNFVRRKILLSLKKSVDEHPFHAPLTLEQAEKLLPVKLQELNKYAPSLAETQPKTSDIQPILNNEPITL
jgi:hypothetical protein